MNAAAGAQLAGFNAKQTMEVARYNADLKLIIGEYDAKLQEDEAYNIWKANDLDVMQKEQEFSKQMGLTEVHQGASGVIMGQDSMLDVLVDQQIQNDLDLMVIKHSADMQAQKMLDGAARSRWDGQMAADQIMYEGQVNSQATLVNASIQNSTALAQAKINIGMMEHNALVSSQRTWYEGQMGFTSHTQQGQQQMTSGMFQAGSTMMSGYTNSKQPASQYRFADTSVPGSYNQTSTSGKTGPDYRESLLA